MIDTAQKNDERINIVYRTSDGEEFKDIELPFRVLVVGGFAGKNDDYDNDEAIPVNLSNVDDVLSSYNVNLELRVSNKLTMNDDEVLDLVLPISSMYDFTPDGIINNVPELLDIFELRELLHYLSSDSVDIDNIDIYLDNLSNKDLIVRFLTNNNINISDDINVEHGSIMTLLSELDKKIHSQLDEIIHNEEFLQLESSWRSLQFLLEATSQDESCSVELISVNKHALLNDFEDVPEITHSKYYDIVYNSEFGQFGGRPYGVIVANYEFGPSSPDIKLAQYVSTVSNLAHAPFIASADCSMFDIDDMSELSRIRDFQSIYDQTKFAKWNSFRLSSESRYFALTVPKFKLRNSYYKDENGNSINYTESTAGGVKHQLWGNSSFAFATRLIDSFIKYRWCINITGMDYGKVDNIHMEEHNSAVNGIRIPTQVLISDRQLKEITAQGFLPLSIHKSSNAAVFFASNSVISSKSYSNDRRGKEAALSHFLGSQLQYLFITCRLAHYLKMMQREHIGAWKNKSDVERELNDWIRQYISDMDNPTSSIRAKRPLRRAKINVSDVDSQQDWYVIEMLITPHLKFMGSQFTLEESGKLDKK